jgi:cytochrome P450
VSALEPRITQLADEVIDGFAGDGHADIVEQFAYPLPLRVILDFIGFPLDDVEQIGRWTTDWIALHFGQPSPDDQVEHARGVAAHYDYVRAFIHERRHRPRDDFASEVLQSVESGEVTASEDELVLLFGTNLTLAAHDALTSVLSSGVLHLMRNRREWEAIRHDPDAASSIIEELLRFDPPGSFFRKTRCDVELGGRVIPAGAQIMFYIPSVNRDETKFADPHSFRPDRTDGYRHLAFSFGHHHCLGAALARAEARAALIALSRRLPTLRLASDQLLEYQPAIPVRLLKRLLVEWDAQ